MSVGCPVSVYPLDTPMEKLGTVELLLVTSLRLWAAAWQDPEAGDPDWRGGFTAVGIDFCAVPAFDSLFGIVASSPLRPLDVRCPHCTQLGRDEARLLQLLSLFQRDRVEEAVAILAEWLPPAALRLALLPAEGLAAALGMGGLMVPLRHREAAAMGEIAPALIDPGFALLH